ncbi:MAG: flagellar hook-length control protein FliK [Syntrophobacterales bacterium]|nr:flagellar hook-length control protein FliK [Syntrophobacterales bacterium]
MELTNNLNLNVIAGNKGAQGAAGTLLSLAPEGFISDVTVEKSPLSKEALSGDFAQLMQRTLSQLPAADIQSKNNPSGPAIPKNCFVAIGDFMSDPYVGKDLRISCLVEKYFREDNVKAEYILGNDIVASFATWEAAVTGSEATPLPGENNKDNQDVFDNTGTAEDMSLFASVSSQPDMSVLSEWTTEEYNRSLEGMRSDQPSGETGGEGKEYQSLSEDKPSQFEPETPEEQIGIIPGHRTMVKEGISGRNQVSETGVVSAAAADMSHFHPATTKHHAASSQGREQVSMENPQVAALAEEAAADANSAKIRLHPHDSEPLPGPAPDKENLIGVDKQVAAMTEGGETDVDSNDPGNRRPDREDHQAAATTALKEKNVAGANAILFPDGRNGAKTTTAWLGNDRPSLAAATAAFERPVLVTPILVTVSETDAEEPSGKKTASNDTIKENIIGKYPTQPKERHEEGETAGLGQSKDNGKNRTIKENFAGNLSSPSAGSHDDPEIVDPKVRKDNGNVRMDKADFMEGLTRGTEERHRGPGKSSEDAFSEHLFRFGPGDVQNLRSERPVAAGLPGENFPAQSVMNQVREGMATGFKDGGRVRITLYPETLGRVDMDIVVRHDRVELVMKVDNEQVRQLLSSHVEDLKTTLQNQGWQVNGVDVTLQKDNNTSDGRNFANLFSWQEKMNQERQSGGMTGGDGGNSPAAGIVDSTPEATTKTEIKVKGLSIFA